MVGKKVEVCNREIGRSTQAFCARWEMHESVVSEEVQIKREHGNVSSQVKMEAQRHMW